MSSRLVQVTQRDLVSKPQSNISEDITCFTYKTWRNQDETELEAASLVRKFSKGQRFDGSCYSGRGKENHQLPSSAMD